MDKLKGIAKDGWHPEKSGKSLTGLLRGGKDSSASSAAAERPTQPLSSLRDPSSFAPPPKHISHPDYDPQAEATHSPVASGKGPPPLPHRDGSQASQPASGAIARKTSPASDRRDSVEDDIPRGPFRVNTTGLSTEGLPAPPTRIVQRSDTAPSSPPKPAGPTPGPKPAPPSVPARETASSSGAANPPATKPKPRLPPRLPPREDPTAAPTTTTTGAPSQAPPLLNQGAVDRLGAAGVNVPGLGIAPAGATHHSSAAAAAGSGKPSLSGHMLGRDANVNELQAKFARIRATEREHDETAGAKAPTPQSAARGGGVVAPPPVPLGTKPK